MALDFFQILGIEPLSLPDGGIYDPTGQSSLSYVGKETRVVGGGDPNKLVVEGSEVSTGAEPGGINPTSTKTFVSGNVENTYTATDGKTFTNLNQYVEHQKAIYLAEDATGGTGNTGGTTGNIGNNTGNATGGGTANRNARDFLIASLKPFFSSPSDAGFLKDLEKIIDDYIKQGYDEETISVLLPETAPYKERFKGNEGRIAAGLGALSPAQYLQAENSYNEILTRFNLKDLSTRDTFSSLIGGMVSAAELTDRVVNVYDRIRNADPALRAELDRVKELGGGVSDADFAKALLTGQTGANELKRKISTAEISAEARTRGLSTTRAEQLQQLGVTREEARAGFETIAQAQPTFEKLAGIFDRQAPAPETTQTELEREVFQGMQSQRRRRLVQQEQAAFSGASGLAGQALSTQRAGQI